MAVEVDLAEAVEAAEVAAGSLPIRTARFHLELSSIRSLLNYCTQMVLVNSLVRVFSTTVKSPLGKF